MFHFATTQIWLFTFFLHSYLVFFVGFFITMQSSVVSAGVSRWSETFSCLHRRDELQHFWHIFAGPSVTIVWLLNFVLMFSKMKRISLTAFVNAVFFPKYLSIMVSAATSGVILTSPTIELLNVQYEQLLAVSSSKLNEL